MLTMMRIWVGCFDSFLKERLLILFTDEDALDNDDEDDEDDEDDDEEDDEDDEDDGDDEEETASPEVAKRWAEAKKQA